MYRLCRLSRLTYMEKISGAALLARNGARWAFAAITCKGGDSSARIRSENFMVNACIASGFAHSPVLLSPSLFTTFAAHCYHLPKVGSSSLGTLVAILCERSKLCGICLFIGTRGFFFALNIFRPPIAIGPNWFKRPSNGTIRITMV